MREKVSGHGTFDVIRSDRVRLLEARSTDEVYHDTAYLFPKLALDSDCRLPSENPKETVDNLIQLANLMVSEENLNEREDNSSIPAGFTYWGQFIDHDITRNAVTEPSVFDIKNVLKADFSPLSPEFVVDNLKNKRTPYLDLDSVYGRTPKEDANNPLEDRYYEDDLMTFRLGMNSVLDPKSTKFPDFLAGSPTWPRLDLPRKTTVVENELYRMPIIGDDRNDENTIVSQFHVAFLKFHNAIVDVLKRRGLVDRREIFRRAQQEVIWHYQWLVVNEYLIKVAKCEIVEKLLAQEKTFFDCVIKPYIPLEFSMAAFRFGHSMARESYDFNRNFGYPNALATFEELFLFTGKGGLPVTDAELHVNLPASWIIEWDRYFFDTCKNSNGQCSIVHSEKTATHPKGVELVDRFARKIDTKLSVKLKCMFNELGEHPAFCRTNIAPEKRLVLHLARRNLLRGYQFSLPTGQSIANTLGIQVLTESELTQNQSSGMNTHLCQSGFVNHTPLWFYVLKEAEVGEKGNSLGELGSYLVAGTLISLLRRDPNSFLNKDWEPSMGVVEVESGKSFTSITDLFRFAGVA